MQLNQFTHKMKVSTPRKRVGRGNATGKGTTASRGSKGQKARSGGAIHPRFEGGQTPFSQRIPKQRGFRKKRRVVFKVINLKDLPRFAEGGKITIEALKKKSFLKKPQDRVKLLGEGEVKEPLEIEVHAASASVIKKIEAVGGKVILVKQYR